MRSSSTRLSPVPELSKALGELFSKWGFGLFSQIPRPLTTAVYHFD